MNSITLIVLNSGGVFGVTRVGAGRKTTSLPGL